MISIFMLCLAIGFHVALAVCSVHLTCQSRFRLSLDSNACQPALLITCLLMLE
jgi:hypothetical protein